MRISVALIFALGLGFISSSLERVWSHLFALSAGGSISGVFALVMGVLLLGFAGGTYLGHPYCKSRHLDPYRFIVKCSFVACIFTYILVPLYSNMLVMSVYLGFLIWIPLMLAIYVAIGSILTVLCHVIKRAAWQSVGRAVGWLYGSYLAGCALGILITGGALTQHFSSVVLFRWLALALGGLPILLLPWLDLRQASQKKLIVQLSVATLTLLGILAWVDDQTTQKLFFKDTFNHRKAFSYTIDSSDGILNTVQEKDSGGDRLFLGGIYEGRYNIDPVKNKDNIDAAYFISSLHSAPLDVLQIGLKDGSWASVFAGNPETENLTVVGMNKAYQRMIDNYSDLKPLLHDEKVQMKFGDGRTYLTQLGPQKFDLIVVNNSSVSQEGGTRFLSTDFILLAARHLKEGGVFALNSDGCPHVHATMANFFSYVVTSGDIVIGAYGSMDMDDSIIAQRLESFRPNGLVVFDTSEYGSKATLEKISGAPRKNLRNELLKSGSVITDYNMRCEFQEHPLVLTMRGWRKGLFSLLPSGK
jgi:spermidine synthase